MFDEWFRIFLTLRNEHTIVELSCHFQILCSLCFAIVKRDNNEVFFLIYTWCRKLCLYVRPGMLYAIFWTMTGISYTMRCVPYVVQYLLYVAPYRVCSALRFEYCRLTCTSRRLSFCERWLVFRTICAVTIIPTVSRNIFSKNCIRDEIIF